MQSASNVSLDDYNQKKTVMVPRQGQYVEKKVEEPPLGATFSMMNVKNYDDGEEAS